MRAEEPGPADIALVLAGDGFGNRILKGAELVQKGYVPKVAVSGPMQLYGTCESDLAIAFAVRHGYPKEWFVPLPHVSWSTEEEARAILPELRRMGVKRLIVVTSDFHTRRAGSVYRRYAPDMQLRVVAAPDQLFHDADWWKQREGRKRVFYEYTKSAAWILGL